MYTFSRLSKPRLHPLPLVFSTLLLSAGVDPLCKFRTCRGNVTSLHGLAIMGGFYGGEDIMQMTELLLNRIGSTSLRSRPKQDKNTKVHPTDRVGPASKVAKACTTRTSAGNNPLHLAIIMVRWYMVSALFSREHAFCALIGVWFCAVYH